MAARVCSFFLVNKTNNAAAPVNPKKNNHTRGFDKSLVSISIAQSVNNAAIIPRNISNDSRLRVRTKHPAENKSIRTIMAQKWGISLCAARAKAAKTPKIASPNRMSLRLGILTDAYSPASKYAGLVPHPFAIRNVAPLTSRLGVMIPHTISAPGTAENTVGAAPFDV